MSVFKHLKIPHTFTIVFTIIVVCAALTWIIPGGEFERTAVTVDGSTKNVVVPHSYHSVERQGQSWQVFSAFFNGFKRTSYIIVFILIIGGAFFIINATKSIDMGIFKFLGKIHSLAHKRVFRKTSLHGLILTVVIIMFSFFGAVFGMSEECIAFIIIFVPLAISMGYDSIVGVLICYVAAHVGFAGALLNPFTIGIAQGLSGLPMFSGLPYRFFCWVLLTLITILFTLWYARKIKKSPEKSPTFKIDAYWRERSLQNEEVDVKKSQKQTYFTYIALLIIGIMVSWFHPVTLITIGTKSAELIIFPILTFCFAILGWFTLRKAAYAFILQLLFFTVCILVAGVLGYQWYIMEIAALFFGLGLASGYAYGIKFDAINKLFLEGCKDIMNAALIVGLAGGIIIILEDGKIIDTVLYGASKLMEESSKTTAVGVMYSMQTLLNMVIPSSSAKAALTIPMMAEFSDMIAVSRQTTVLAFQLGDGFTNMITPTSGVLIGCLGVARIPYSVWFKFILPFILTLVFIGFILLMITNHVTLSGF